MDTYQLSLLRTKKKSIGKKPITACSSANCVIEKKPHEQTSQVNTSNCPIKCHFAACVPNQKSPSEIVIM